MKAESTIRNELVDLKRARNYYMEQYGRYDPDVCAIQGAIKTLLWIVGSQGPMTKSLIEFNKMESETEA